MPYLNSPRKTPKTCPVCGEHVPPKSLACRECGADHLTGWAPGALDSDGIDLPDDDFDYNEFIEKEFGSPTSARPKHLHPIWWIAGLITILAFLTLVLLRPLQHLIQSLNP